MKSRTLIAISTLMLALLVIGCSSNTTGPANLNNPTDLRLPNDNGAVGTRFNDGTNDTPVIERMVPPFETLAGGFYSDRFGCISVKINKVDYVELEFNGNTPYDIPNGTTVVVHGSFNMHPGMHCQLLQSFRAIDMVVLTGRQGGATEGLGDGN